MTDVDQEMSTENEGAALNSSSDVVFCNSLTFRLRLKPSDK